MPSPPAITSVSDAVGHALPGQVERLVGVPARQAARASPRPRRTAPAPRRAPSPRGPCRTSGWSGARSRPWCRSRANSSHRRPCRLVTNRRFPGLRSAVGDQTGARLAAGVADPEQHGVPVGRGADGPGEPGEGVQDQVGGEERAGHGERPAGRRGGPGAPRRGARPGGRAAVRRRRRRRPGRPRRPPSRSQASGSWPAALQLARVRRTRCAARPAPTRSPRRPRASRAGRRGRPVPGRRSQRRHLVRREAGVRVALGLAPVVEARDHLGDAVQDDHRHGHERHRERVGGRRRDGGEDEDADDDPRSVAARGSCP